MDRLFLINQLKSAGCAEQSEAHQSRAMRLIAFGSILTVCYLKDLYQNTFVLLLISMNIFQKFTL